MREGFEHLRCPMCGGNRLRPMGLGVESLEEAVRDTFPGVRALRWDRDVTRGRNDHEQILSCLTDDIEWTVFGAFHVTGKEAYDKAIDGAPEFIDPPELEVVRMVEQGDVVMAELSGTAKRIAGGEMRMSMAEVFVMRDSKIAERRAWVIVLNENNYR